MKPPAPPRPPDTSPSKDEREHGCSLILSAEEWQLLVAAAAIAGPDVSLDEFARDLLVREARRTLAGEDELH